MRPRFGALLLTLAALGHAALGSPAQGSAEQGAREQNDTPPSPAPVELDPAELPRAAAGRWKDWDPGQPPSQLAQDHFRAASLAAARGELLRSLEQLFATLHAEPDYPPALYQAGIALFRLRRYGDAALFLERYLEASPTRVGDTRALAHCYYTLGQHAKAREHYARVLAARPEGEVEALFGYALCHLRLDEVPRALELLGQVLEQDPEHAEAHLWLAQIHYEQGDLEAAAAASERVLELAPYQARTWFLRARILIELGRGEEAEAAQVRFGQLDRVEQAVRALEGRLELNPRQAEVHAQLVELWRSVGDLESVRAGLRRWMLLAPSDLGLRVHALDVLEGMGDLSGAGVAALELERLAAEAQDAAAWRRLARWYALTRQRVKQIEAEDHVRRLTRSGD